MAAGTRPKRAVFQAQSATGSRSTARLALGVGLLAVVAIGSLVGWSGWNTYQRHLEEQQRQAYIQGARQGALNLTTIDSQRADADIQRILDGSTGAFHDDFQKRSQPFIAAVKQAESKTQGTIAEAALESVGDDQAQVLLEVEVKTSVAGVEEPQPRAWRMRINVQNVGSQAKVSNVAFVP
jgi:Mce-associated membrane protein